MGDVGFHDLPLRWLWLTGWLAGWLAGWQLLAGWVVRISPIYTQMLFGVYNVVCQRALEGIPYLGFGLWVRRR